MFEKLKKDYLRKLEKTTIKSNLDGEIVYLKKGGLLREWKRIYPAVNENGTWNIPNLLFGGKKNLIRLGMMLVIVFSVYAGIYDTFRACEQLALDPCVQSCMKIGTSFNIAG